MNAEPRIREILSGLRRAEIPAPPTLRAAPADRHPILSPRLALAAILLLALVAILYRGPRPPSRDTPGALAGRLSAVEKRIARVEHEELRALLHRELELLRRELKLALERR